jgi:hypothetical protein
MTWAVAVKLGKKQAHVEMLMTVLEERGLATPTARERVEATDDLDTFERWVLRAISASALDDVFGEDS